MGEKMPEEKPLCLYIVVKETLSPGMMALAAAHASLAIHLKYGHLPEMQDWVERSFRKKIVLANGNEWRNILAIAEKENMPHQIMTESRMDNAETCVVFSARKEWPKAFKFLRMA